MRKISHYCEEGETETAVSCEEESCDVFVGEGGFVDVDQS